jgi:hypothetical protein
MASSSVLPSVAFFDALAGAGVDFQDFGYRDAAAAVSLGQEPLADDVAEAFGEKFAQSRCLRCGRWKESYVADSSFAVMTWSEGASSGAK